jgi:hypothetical protein
VAQYSVTDAEAEASTETVTFPDFTIDLTGNAIDVPIVPGSVCFTWGGNTFYDVLGSIYSNLNPSTGVGTLRGSIDYLTGIITLDVYDSGDNTVDVKSLAGRLGSQYVTEVAFRTSGNPLRSGSLTVSGVSYDGTRFSVTDDGAGNLTGDFVEGTVDTDTGIVSIGFGELITDDGSYTDEYWYSSSLTTDAGQVWKPTSVYADSLSYSCVVYSYIPLDSDLLGINPVRLPTDGKVNIVKSGDVVVIHNTRSMSVENPTAGATITLPRTTTSVEVYDSSSGSTRLPSTMYAFEEETDSLTWDEDADFSDYTLPLLVMHKIEDMRLVSSTQINGQIVLSKAVKHDYDADDTLVSSALLFGDLKARATNYFDQETWSDVFNSSLSGDAASGTYNTIDYPITVKNSGAVDERWALVFDSSTHFNIVGENRGTIGEGYITQDCEPTSTLTGNAYFFLDYNGFGDDWSAGNAIRFDTYAATAPVWVCRTTLQGDETESSDYFTIQPRGDAA